MSKISVKQIEQAELSGYIQDVYLSDLGDVIDTANGAAETGSLLSGAFSNINNQFNNFSGSFNTLSGNIDSLEDEYSLLGIDISNLSGIIYNVSGLVITSSGYLISHVAGVSGFLYNYAYDINTYADLISGNVDDLEVIVSTATGDLALISGRLTSLSGIVTGNDNTLSGLITGNSGRLNSLSGAFTGFTGRYVNDYVSVCDSKTSGTAGGGFTAGSWVTRAINTEVSDVSAICSISSNQIILAGGIYLCDISCPAYKVNSHKSRLLDLDASVLLSGTSEFTHNTDASILTRSTIKGKFTLPSTGGRLEIQHICQTTNGTDGFGVCAGVADSGPNIYTLAEFRRIST